MIQILIFILCLGLILIAIEFLKRELSAGSSFSSDKESSYKLRPSVFNKSEEAFFFELKKQLPQGYHIFPKMRIADIIETTNGKGYYFLRNKILPKHVDFLICDSYFKPVVGIELDGGYHGRENIILADSLKDKIFSLSGLKLERIRVGTNFMEDVGRIRSHLM